MGCGTSILSILASKLGAKKIDAIDNNPLCLENSKENILVNNCCNINLILDKHDHEYDLSLEKPSLGH